MMYTSRLFCLALLLASTAPLSAATRTFVVATDGDDTADGSEAHPWQTLAHAAAQVQPGDTVLVREGEYPAGTVLKTSGEPNKPIAFRAYPDEKPRINGHGESPVGIELNNVQHVRVQGFTIREIRTPNPRDPKILHRQGGILLVESSDCFVVKNRILTGGDNGYDDEANPGATGIQLWSPVGGRGCHRNAILGNDVCHGAYGIHLRGAARHNLIENNFLFENQELTNHSDAIKCESIRYELNHPKAVGLTSEDLSRPEWAEHAPRENVIRHNDCVDNSDDGIDTWVSVANLVEFNHVSKNGTGPKKGDGNGFKLGPGGHNVVRCNVSTENADHAFTDNGGVRNVYEFNADAIEPNNPTLGEPSRFASAGRYTELCDGFVCRAAQPVPAGISNSVTADVDIAVYGTTPAGIIATIAAAIADKKVLIIAESRELGGLQTSGLGNTNAGQRATLGGMTRQFHQKVRDWYKLDDDGDGQQIVDCQDGLHFEPRVAADVYLAWLPAVDIVTSDRLASLEIEGSKIVAGVTSYGHTIKAKVWIDASYTGDLLAMAGCESALGREGKDQYNESLAGVRYPAEQAGQGDKKLQCYDWRLCLTDDPKNQIAFEKPLNYDPAVFAWHAAQMKADPPKTAHEALPLNMMPNRKTDTRTGEWIGASWNYPEANRAERMLIAQKHREYSQQFLWWLLHDAPLDEDVRKELSRWGYAADEFVDNGYWPYEIYVREARRLVGDYVMTQPDVMEDRFKPDGVAIGSFFLDVHPVQLVEDADAPGGFRAEGNLGNPRVKPYEIPYRVLLPKRAECMNLLVPVCMSASHVAYSTLRMEPVYMMLGEAAGTAASLAIEKDIDVRDVPIDELRAKLLENGAVLDARPFDDVWPPRKSK